MEYKHVRNMVVGAVVVALIVGYGFGLGSFFVSLGVLGGAYIGACYSVTMKQA